MPDSPNLLIARAITLAHDGEISLESQPCAGTTARVSVPLARRDRDG